MSGARGTPAPIALAYAAFVLIGLGAGAGGVLLPAQIADYGVDKATIGITFFALSAGFVLAGTTAGQLLHRLGTRASLVVGGCAYLVAGLCLATRPPFAALVAVHALAGYGSGVLESVLNAYLAGLDRATVRLNRLHAFFGVGALLGPLLAAWLLGFLAWTAVWLVLALAAAPLVAGFLLAYPSAGPRTTAEPPAGAEPTRPGLFGAVLREPAVLLGAAFLAVYVGLESGVGTWGFSFLVEEHGLRTLLAGYAVSGYWLGLTLGRFLISPLAARIGLSAARTSFACLAGVTVAAAAAWLAPGAAVAAGALAVLGFFLGPLFPTAMAVVPDITAPRLVATAIGVMNAGSVVGGALFPWLAGTVAQGAGAWTLPPFAVALGLLQAVLWWLVASRIGRAQDPPTRA